MPSSSTRPIGFLDTALETRRQIYQYCLVREDPIIIDRVDINLESLRDPGVHDQEKSLLLVSKQVGSEASDVLYGENVFQVSIDKMIGNRIKENFSDACIRKIRRLQVVMGTHCVAYGNPLDHSLWIPILASLKSVTLVAHQPWISTTDMSIYWDLSFSRLKLEQWTEWLTKILKFITSKIPSTCVIEVDINGQEETKNVVKECLPIRYREVQTLAGDILFSRDGYAERSSVYSEEDEDVNYDNCCEYCNTATEDS